MTYKPNDKDRTFVEQAVQAGTTIGNICKCLRMDDATLRKYYEYEIVTARTRMTCLAASVVVNNLNDGNLGAAMYVLNRVAGWTEKVDMTSSDGSMSPKAGLDVSRLSPAARAEILAMNDAGDDAPDPE